VSAGGPRARRAAEKLVRTVQAGTATSAIARAGRILIQRAQQRAIHYQAGGFWRALHAVIREMTTLVPLLRETFDYGPRQEVGLAMRLLEAFADQPEVQRWAAEVLRGRGYQVVAPGEEESPPRRPPREGKPHAVIVGGVRYPADHPLVTGEMLQTPESSNVYSYGYDLETRSLYVRFKAPVEHRGGRSFALGRPHVPGPLYRYFNVPPEVFLRMHASRSKGDAVWDLLRIRGTVSGHRYDYALVGITQGYVPRKATLGVEGEWFLEREVVGRSGRVYRSRPARLVRPLPERGLPDRGWPDRGI
jgi:hypothetical protein